MTSSNPTRKHTIRSLIREAIRLYLPEEIFLLFLFGSQAGCEELRRSDFDIGILGPTPVDPAIFSRIRLEVDELPVLYPIDIVDLTTTPETFKAVALGGAEPL